MSVQWGDVPTWVQASSIVFAVLTFYDQKRKTEQIRRKEIEDARRERERTARLAHVKFWSPCDTGLIRPARVIVTNASTESMYQVKVRLKVFVPNSETTCVTAQLPSIAGRVANSSLAISEDQEVDIPPQPGLDSKAEWPYEWILEFVDEKGGGWRKDSAGSIGQFELNPELPLFPTSAA